MANHSQVVVAQYPPPLGEFQCRTDQPPDERIREIQKTVFGLFAALSFDDGKTWPVRKLVTPGGPDRMVNGIDRSQFTLGDTMAEPRGYLAATQTRDGNVQLISSKNHYVFNLAWFKQLPSPR